MAGCPQVMKVMQALGTESEAGLEIRLGLLLLEETVDC